jgi:hypothetical protein
MRQLTEYDIKLARDQAADEKLIINGISMEVDNMRNSNKELPSNLTGRVHIIGLESEEPLKIDEVLNKHNINCLGYQFRNGCRMVLIQFSITENYHD